jgi:hypothetical protein
LDEGYRLARQKHPGTALGLWPAPGRTQRNPTGDCSCFYYFFMAIVVIRYETKTAARRALTFIVRIFVNDTIAITVWTRFYFHACLPLVRTGRAMQGSHEPDCLFIGIACLHAGYRAEQVMVDVRYWHRADLDTDAEHVRS